MRHLRILSLAVALVALVAGPARAEEGLKLPSWGGEDILLRATSLPEGWKAVEGEASLKAAAAFEEPVKAILAKEEIDDLDVATAVVSIQNAKDEVVTIFFLDVDAEPKGVPAAIAALAKENGWEHRELGTPLRQMLVAGPAEARAAAIAAQMLYGAAALTQRGMQRVAQAGQAASEGAAKAAFESGLNLARAAIVLEPRAAAPHALLGLVAAGEAQQKEGSATKEDWMKAVEEFRKAFSKDAVLPPAPPLAYQALGSYGLCLLSLKDPAANAEARKALEAAIGLEQHDQGGQMKGQNRYNLACALSLLGEKAEAIKHLETSLVAMKAVYRPEAFEKFVKEHIPADKDLDNVRNEPGFAEAVERASKGGSSNSGI